jgi:hypothetical protein
MILPFPRVANRLQSCFLQTVGHPSLAFLLFTFPHISTLSAGGRALTPQTILPLFFPGGVPHPLVCKGGRVAQTINPDTNLGGGLPGG